MFDTTTEVTINQVREYLYCSEFYRKISCLSFQDEFQEEVGWLDNHHQISLPGIPIASAENPKLLLSAVCKFHNKAIPVIWKLCAAWRWCYRSAKLIHFQWDTVCSDTIGGRGRMLRDVIMQIPYFTCVKFLGI